MLKTKCICSKSKVKNVKTMSSRGAIIANIIVIDLDLLLQSTIVVDVRLRDVGICWKAPL